MKISAILLILTGSLFFSSPGTATVQQIQGVDVYVYSVPVRDYEVIDRGTIAVATNCENVIKKSAGKAADLKADGVIVDLPAKFTAIRYK